MKKLLYGQNYPSIDISANLRQYEVMDRDLLVANQDYGREDNCTDQAPSRAFTTAATRVPETVYTATEITEDENI